MHEARCPVQISDKAPAVLTEGFREVPQPTQANAESVPTTLVTTDSVTE
jgi:hypothetical protein